MADYGSYQMGTLNSGLPLVLQAAIAQQGQGQRPLPPQQPQGADVGPFPLNALFNLFGRAPPAPQAKEQSPASSDVIKNAPSSHGSSLAAVLQQLGLSDSSWA
jgi:hypothetical protein